MADYKDIFGIGEKPVRTEVNNDGKAADALSFFGVPVKEKEEEK